ncbi:peptidylprolyl isomerase [Planctomycetaceae bacterium SH139]
MRRITSWMLLATVWLSLFTGAVGSSLATAVDQPPAIRDEDSGAGAPETSPAKSPQPLVRVGQTELDSSLVEAWMARNWQAPSQQLDAAQLRTLRSAALLSLVRRELAFQQLLASGGEPLLARVERRKKQALQALQRIEPAAELTSLQQAELGWEVVWNEYLQQQLTEANLERFYQLYHYRYDGTKVQLWQIFRKHPADSDSSAEATEPHQPPALLVELAAGIKAGSLDFATAAREHSQAPTAAQDGLVGWVTAAADLPRDVAEVALQASENQVAGPVRSRFGWHLLWISQRQAGQLAFANFADRRRLQKDAAAFLFDRAVTQSLDKHSVQWLEPSWQPTAAQLDRLRDGTP